MANEELTNYIKESKQQGFSDEQIKKALLDVGWKENDVNEEFNLAGSESKSEAPLSSVSVSKLPGVGTLLKESLLILKSRFFVFTALILIPVVIAILLQILLVGGAGIGIAIIFSKFAVGKLILFILMVILLVILFIIIQAWGQTSLIYAVIGSEEKISIIQAIKKGWKKILSFWWVSFLLSFITTGGMLLLIVPGIIFAIWFAFAVYILIAENVKGMDALLKSKEYVKNYWWSVFGRLIFGMFIAILVYLFFLLLSKLINIAWIISVISALLGIVVTSFVLIYNYLIYKNLKSIKKDLIFSPKSKTKTILVLCGMLGFLIMIGVLGFMIYKSINRGNIPFNKAGGIMNEQLEKSRSISRDTKRVGDLRMLTFALEQYYDNNGTYPVAEFCSVESWSNMITQIGYVSEDFVDPLNSGDNVYLYSSDRTSYVLWSRLENLDNSALSSQYDKDGKVLDCYCDDPVYCDGYISNNY